MAGGDGVEDEHCEVAQDEKGQRQAGRRRKSAEAGEEEPEHYRDLRPARPARDTEGKAATEARKKDEDDRPPDHDKMHGERAQCRFAEPDGDNGERKQHRRA